MANTAKTSKTSKAKKPATKKTAAKKGTIVPKGSVDAVALNQTQQKLLEGIKANEETIVGNVRIALNLAADSGKKITQLKDQIQKKYGKVWKKWAEKNLPMSYRQAAKYMVLAGNLTKVKQLTAQAEKAGETLSINEAVAQLSKTETPEKQAERKEQRDSGTASRNATAILDFNDGIPEGVLSAIDATENVENLKLLADYIDDRIEKINSIPTTHAYDENEGAEADAADDEADAQEHVDAAIA